MTKQKSFIFMGICLVIGIVLGAISVIGFSKIGEAENATAAAAKRTNSGSFDSAIFGASNTEEEIPEEQQSYIVDLKLAAAYWDRYACNATSELRDKYGNDYQRVQDFNLNRDCGTTTDCIYLYEERSYEKQGAITNLLAVCSDKEIEDYCIYDEYGIMYEVIDGIRINGLHSSVSVYDKIDLNMGAGGKYIYLFATRCTAYEPITDINIESDLLNADHSYIGVTSNTVTDRFQDFNQGAGGADVYIMFTRAITGWTAYELKVIDYSEDGSEMEKVYTYAVREKKILSAHLQPWLEKGEYAHFNGYKYSNGTAVNVGDTIRYDGMEIYADWTYDIIIDMSAFGEEDIYKTNVQKIGSFPSVSKAGYLVKGWQYADTKQGAGPYNVLRKGGVVEPILEKAHPSYFESFQLSCELNQDSPTFLMIIYKNGLTDSVKYHGSYLADLYILYAKGYEYKDGAIVKKTTTESPVKTDIDYSAATDEEKLLVDTYANYLFVANETDIIFTIDYFENEGAAEHTEVFCQTVINLANKELTRRGLDFLLPPVD